MADNPDKITEVELANGTIVPLEEFLSWSFLKQSANTKIQTEETKAQRIATKKARGLLNHKEEIATALSKGIDVFTIAGNCGTSMKMIENNYAHILNTMHSTKLAGTKHSNEFI